MGPAVGDVERLEATKLATYVGDVSLRKEGREGGREGRGEGVRSAATTWK